MIFVTSLKLRSKPDFETLVLGAMIFATGGSGGDPKRSMEVLREALFR